MIEFVCNCGQVNNIPKDIFMVLSATECLACGNVTSFNDKHLGDSGLSLTFDNCRAIFKTEGFMMNAEHESEMLLNSCLTMKEFNSRHLHLDGFYIVDHLLSETHEKYLDDEEKSNKMWEFMDHIKKYLMRG
jgi:hypothetical protein